MISDLSAKMLNAWAELAGVVPGATSFSSNSYEATKKFEQATKGLELDPSGISTAMLAHGFYGKHVGATKFSLNDLLEPSAEVKALLEKTRGFKSLLDDQVVADAVQGFKDSITKALSHYEVEVSGDLELLLKSNVDMAEMRLSALNSIKELRMDQFLRGEPEEPGVNPVFMKTIFKWWNINSLLAAAVRMPSGISLHMISTPKAFDTFFVFLIRNGGNLYILSDVAKEKHPLYSSSTRRPDRKFSDRINQNWFPYELADVEWVEGEEDEWHVYQTASKARDLVAYQHESRPLSAINKLEAAPTVWLSMMFSLIMKRFWGSNEQAQELSYTGEMVLNAQALLQRASLANLPVVSTAAIEATVIDKQMISTEIATEDGIGKIYNMTTAWMVERYADQVDDEVLNLTASQDETIGLALTHEGTVKVHSDDKQDKDLQVAASYPYPTTRFGSLTNLENDRMFLARSNFAESISLLAQAEFNARHVEIEKWFAQAVRRNLENLIALSGNESIWIDDGENTGLDNTTRNNRAACRSKDGRLFHRFMGRAEVGSNHNFWPALGLYESNHNGYNAKCNVTGAKATYIVGFTPANAKELAVLVGCEVNELPDVLQHWTIRRHRAGNHLTDRIDPMSWRLKDPWAEAIFNVNLALSKRGLAQVQKTPKLPPLAIATTEQMQQSSFTTSILG